MSADNRVALQQNLEYLQLDTLSILLVTTGIGAWLCFSWSILPDVHGPEFRSLLWIPSGFLLGCIGLAALLRKRHYKLATLCFLGGLSGAILVSLHLLTYAPLAYLYSIVIVFAGVLLKRKRFILLILLVVLAVMRFEMVYLMFEMGEYVVFSIILACITVGTWVSTYSLQVALTWMMSAYEQARKNEAMIREQKMELLHTMAKQDAIIGQLRTTSQHLQEARLQAEESRKLKQQFAQTISHELRTPLNLIVGFTETMVKSPEYYGDSLPTPYLRDLSIVYRNATHLQNMVNDVLDLARMEQASMELLFSPLALDSILLDAMETIGSLIQQRGLTFDYHIQPSLPLILGDVVRIKQILLNLLSNAIRFTEQGAISVHAVTGETDIVVCIEDSGIGIPANRVETIFEPFHQLDSSLQRQAGGTGLGLTITKHLIELHKGTIWVESEVGVGSRFYFSLPIHKAAEAVEDVSLTLESVSNDQIRKRFGVDAYLIKPFSREHLYQTISAFPSHKQKVLIVDDNADFVRLMNRFLQSFPITYRIMGASSASEAIALITLHQPDIVFLDLHLPDAKGSTLVGEIQAVLPSSSHLIIISAYEAVG